MMNHSNYAETDFAKQQMFADSPYSRMKMLTAQDIADILGISVSVAYRHIKTMNEELAAKGYITVSGKIPRRYFEERVYI